MMLENLAVREKLERPIIRVFQRHPGNNMPEAQEIVKVRQQPYSEGLLFPRLYFFIVARLPNLPCQFE